MSKIIQRNISLLQKAIMSNNLARQRILVPSNFNSFFSKTIGMRILPTLTMVQDLKRRNISGRRNLDYSAESSRPGDWICKGCGFNNFSFRNSCKSCGEKPENRYVAEGDWVCPNCEFYNFRSRTVCFKCDTPSPNPPLEVEGDWTCPNCKFLNFKSRLICLKCDTASPN
ncbi:14701_t:CDS:2 [Funneliformis geosporum]|uniref:9833_t:CDS:1 n=1 Tax=Funneliformis geosporum TaxID=1117311 RepID=A0A9W4SFS3_9GLOM|nr:9833_t:CDS:2 [Funneliformis geosporum]CAI2171007.1 14701_t:CDS:2 [Funneliformis geosporum]